MPGPWEKYQATQPQEEGPWTKYAQPATSIPVPPAGDPSLLDRVNATFANNPGEGQSGGYSEHLRPIGNLGRRAVRDIAGQVSEFGQKLTNPSQWGWRVGSADARPGNPDVIDQAKSYWDTAKNNSITQAASDIGGDALAMYAGGKAIGKISEAAPQVVPKIGRFGETLQDAGAKLINNKFPPTMKEVIRGNNPGRGILNAGIGPTISRGSLATKVAGAQEAIGSRIGDVVGQADQNELAPPIYSRDLHPLAIGPINEALGRINGPFGTASPEPYQTLFSKLGNKAPGASTPIFGESAPEVVQPSDLWNTIKNLDANTRFNVDPEVESVNETRRDIRHGLRPILESTAPTLKPLSQTYSDLSSASDALDRSQSGSRIPRGVSGVIDATINSTPVNTTAASALFKTGAKFKNFATNAPEWMGGQGGAPSSLPFAPRKNGPALRPLLPAQTVGEPGGENFSQGGFPSSRSIVTPAPVSRFGLPSEASPGEVSPMVGVKSARPQPLAQDYARTRVVPGKGELSRIGGTTLPSEHSGLALPSGSLLGLPETAGPGETQPMIGIKSTYPPLAKEFARERVPATVFPGLRPIANGIFTIGEDGQIIPTRRGLPSPSKTVKTKK